MMMATFSAEPYGCESLGVYSRRSVNDYCVVAATAPASASCTAIARPIPRDAQGTPTPTPDPRQVARAREGNALSSAGEQRAICRRKASN